MKKWMKGTLITGGILVAAGIGMITVGAVNGGGSCLEAIPQYERMLRHERNHGYAGMYGEPETRQAELPAADTAESQEQKKSGLSSDEVTDALFSGVSELDLENCGGETNITVSSQLAEGEIQVRQQGEGEAYQIRKEGPELKISVPEQWESRFAERGLSGEEKMKHLEILLPEGFRFREVTLETVAGVITAENIQAEKLSLEAVSGSIEISGGSVGRIETETVSGTISCMAMADQEASVENVSGDTVLFMVGDMGDYDYQIERAGGQILLNGTTVVEYGSNGGETRINNRRGREIDIECVGGSVTLQYEAALQQQNTVK